MELNEITVKMATLSLYSLGDEFHHKNYFIIVKSILKGILVKLTR